MKRLDLAYLAGIADGEAWIGIRKSKAYRCQGRTTPGYHASLRVKMVDRRALDVFISTLGGWVFTAKAYLKSGRPFFCYQLSDLAAEKALRALLPFLRVKREQALAVLALRALQSEGAKHRTKVVGTRVFPNAHGTPRTVQNKSFSDEYVARCEAFYLQCRKLNRVGLAALEP